MLQQSVDMSTVLMQYGYRMSKSALNMAGATMAKDLQQSQVTHCDAAMGLQACCSSRLQFHRTSLFQLNCQGVQS